MVVIKAHLHARRNNRRTDVAGLLYLLEGHHHTDNRAEETQRRGHGDETGLSTNSLLKVGSLHRAVRRYAALYVLHRLVHSHQALVTD